MVLAAGSAPGVPTTQRTRRFNEWRDVIRDNFVALDIAADRRGGHFDGTVRSATLGHLQVSEVRSTPQICRRTADLVRRDSAEYLQVGLVTQGAGVIEQDGRRATLRAGDFAVYETGREFCWELTGGWELYVFTWPRATIELSAGESATVTARGFAGHDGLSGIVGGMLRGLVTGAPSLTPGGAVRVADEVGELIATLAIERPEHRGAVVTAPQADLMRRISDYIADHLGDPELGPATVAHAHYISTRQLHRLFAGESDTVARRIRRLRIEHCRRDLLDRRLAAVSITDIVRRWGFTDLPGFSRSFRAAYGVAPSEYRTRHGC